MQKQQLADQPTVPLNSNPPPPLPPKHRLPKAPQQPKANPSMGYDSHANHKFRDRIGSHDARVTTSAARHPNGNFRAGPQGRLMSDSASIHLSMSPPNTPPPPYTKYDQNHKHHHHSSHNRQPLTSLPHNSSSSSSASRHFSMSQQSDSSSHSTHMKRTRSQGHVPYRRVHIPPQRNGSEGGDSEGGIRDRVITPEVFAEVNSGTLV